MYVVEGTYPYITSVPPCLHMRDKNSLHSVTLEKVLTVRGFGYPPVALGLTVGFPEGALGFPLGDACKPMSISREFSGTLRYFEHPLVLPSGFLRKSRRSYRLGSQSSVGSP